MMEIEKLTEKRLKEMQKEINDVNRVVVDYGEPDSSRLFDQITEPIEIYKALTSLNENGYNVYINAENFRIYIDIDVSPDDPLYDDIVEIRVLVNQKIETRHYGYDYCPKCNRYNPVVYTAAQRNLYQNTTQLCNCGYPMERGFGSKEEIEEIVGDEHFFDGR